MTGNKAEGERVEKVTENHTDTGQHPKDKREGGAELGLRVRKLQSHGYCTHCTVG